MSSTGKSLRPPQPTGALFEDCVPRTRLEEIDSCRVPGIQQ